MEGGQPVRSPGPPLALTGHVHRGSRAGAQHRRRPGVESSPVPKNGLDPRKCGGMGAGPMEEARRAFETHLSVVRGAQGRPVRPQRERRGRAAAGGQAGRRLGRAGSRRGAGLALGALGGVRGHGRQELVSAGPPCWLGLLRAGAGRPRRGIIHGHRVPQGTCRASLSLPGTSCLRAADRVLLILGSWGRPRGGQINVLPWPPVQAVHGGLSRMGPALLTGPGGEVWDSHPLTPHRKHS